MRWFNVAPFVLTTRESSLPLSPPESSILMETSPPTEFPYASPVPPQHSVMHRTLILCSDGTDNKISTKPSNVAQFFSLLKKDLPSNQLVYYQTGIGTYTSSNIVDPVSSKVIKIVDSMFATSIASHVKDGYEFIMQHYLNDDRICIFGFSRGGYIARALAGMVHKVGLLPRGNNRHVKYAYKVFSQTGKEGWEQAAQFKRCYCMDIPIEFVGIWDSVGSVGLNSPGLPFSKASTTIKTFRHALSFDERRALFNANTWHCHEDALSMDPDSGDTGRQLELQQIYAPHPNSSRTDVLEVWFSGYHSDVGGGSVEAGTRHSLSRIPLRWMVRECFKAKTGILFSSQSLRGIGLDPKMLWPDVQLAPRRQWGSSIESILNTILKQENEPEQKSEEVEELWDIFSPAHDKLKSMPIWWILEVIPLQRWFRRSDETVSSHFSYVVYFQE